MGKWSEMAARLEREAEDNRDDRDKTPALMPRSGPNVSIVPNVPSLLAACINDGIAQLQSMPAPRITRLEVWPMIVADAKRLVDDGWAQQALALGWHELELFGVGAKSSAEFEGLAVWLAGRRLILIDERSAIAADGNGRAYFSRLPDFDPSRAVYLWDYGRK